MAVLGRSRSGAPPDQILDPPLKIHTKIHTYPLLAMQCHSELTPIYNMILTHVDYVLESLPGIIKTISLEFDCLQ